MRRVAVASCIGTTIEWYDFYIYGLAAALVFPAVFFPALGDTAGTVAAFATFGVAFVARPFGALLFGHYGDRIGRKATLVVTLVMMGLATVLVGLVPASETIGVAAPIILVVLRVVQGIAVGGEWAGAVLLTGEYAPANKRGFYAMFPQLGPAIAYGLSSGTFLITGLTLGDVSDAFLDYGWRIPFVLSIALVGVGLYIRLKIEETPVFQEDRARRSGAGAHEKKPPPFLDVLRHQAKEVFLAAGVLTVLFSLFYMGAAYLNSYGTTILGLGRPFVLGVGVLASVVFGATTIWSAMYSDRVGRRRIVTGCCALAAVWLLVLFPILDSGSPMAFAAGVVITLGIFGIGYGPVGAMLPELFETRFRYTGAGLGYNLAGILGGAIPPIVAAPLAAAYGGVAVGVMLSAMAVLSLVCTRLVLETKARKL
jgi:MFS family permease